ncbi:helix-turn-helix domain-containing protein [Pusillimonas sp. CC-YST705]|uniref:Helix-turn-helix domain-containing protein n=1 Tax=Mesopusillimonas faecipullorum TaxID=2755040 RepID=A0ABS8CFL6_9BURK|nr:helix-turn-helix domain-containing protein [Mesopusillimonas faecipullorum]MCB5364825.1 helix-turn-helix domain-containing protein [Mesopusillimonas faecipullorum]
MQEDTQATKSASASATHASSHAVKRVFQLLDYLAQGFNSHNLSELARQTGINRVTAMRLLQALNAEGIVSERQDGGHELGLKFLALAARSLGASDFNAQCQKALQTLSRQFHVSAYHVLPESDNVFYLASAMPATPLTTNIRTGVHVPFFAVTPGLVIWAYQNDATRHRMLQEALAKWPGKKASLATLPERRARILNEGCAWSFSEFDQGINACAAPLLDAQGQVRGAISLVAPEVSFPDESVFRQSLSGALLHSCHQLGALLTPS